jgi:hypothetical protein
MSKKKVAPKLTYKFDVMNEKPMLDEFTRTQLKLALERLVQKGLIFDTGRRRNGQIVWAKTPLAARFARRRSTP